MNEPPVSELGHTKAYPIFTPPCSPARQRQLDDVLNISPKPGKTKSNLLTRSEMVKMLADLRKDICADI